MNININIKKRRPYSRRKGLNKNLEKLKNYPLNLYLNSQCGSPINNYYHKYRSTIFNYRNKTD